MSLTTPRQNESLAQTLYKVAARTGIELKLERLTPTLSGAKLEKDDQDIERLELSLEIAVTSREEMKTDARRIREIADLIEAAADKPRPR